MRQIIPVVRLDAAPLGGQADSLSYHKRPPYPHLRSGLTGDGNPSRLCEQILADEVAHIRFQCECLAILTGGMVRGRGCSFWPRID